MVATIVPSRTSSIEVLQAAFLALLPTIQAHARLAFCHVRCPQTCDDFVAEAVALAWQAFVALTRRGRDAGAFVNLLALCSAQAVKAGRRLAGPAFRNEVLSDLARRRRDLVIEHLADDADGADVTSVSKPFEEAESRYAAAV